jgi:hypothetical protein
MSETYYQNEHPQFDKNTDDIEAQNDGTSDNSNKPLSEIPIAMPNSSTIHYVSINNPINTNVNGAFAPWLYVMIIWNWLVSLAGQGYNDAVYKKHFMYMLITIGYTSFDTIGLLWCFSYIIYYFKTRNFANISSLREITLKHFLFVFGFMQLLFIYSTITIILMFIYTKYDIGDIYYLIIYCSFLIVYFPFMAKFYQS